MSLNQAPSGERTHIGFFGLRNAGKSSLVNAVTGQSLSLVSDIAGTTTDPVKKAMELLPLGPVVIIDTPGVDDEGPLGEMRVKRTHEVLDTVHLAVLVVDATRGASEADHGLVSLFESRKIPYLIALNKTDLPLCRGRTSATRLGCNRRGRGGPEGGHGRAGGRDDQHPPLGGGSSEP